MININGKEYRNIQEQVEKNQEDIKEIKESTIDAYSKTEADDKFETISDVYGNFYTRDQSDARFPTETHMNLLLGQKQNTLIQGNNISITNDEISVTANPIFTNVVMDNSAYYSNNFNGVAIEYNESGDNDEGHIIMSGNCPELYSYNDHLHGEYGNDSKLQMLEDIKVTKTGYSNYPDGYYTKTYDLIDTLESHENSINNLTSKEIPTYGLEWAGADNYDTRYPMQYDFQTLIDAGMPILGTTTETETNYPDSYIILPKSAIFKVRGYFAIKRQSGGYQVFAAADKSSNRLNQYCTYDATRVTARIMNVDNARPNAQLIFSPTEQELALGVRPYIVPLTGSANGQTSLSGEIADDTSYSLKTAYYKIPVTHPIPNVRYDTQITMPTADGTYVLKATISHGVTTLEWVAENNN